MTTNFNTNSKRREYSYKSHVYDDFPVINVTYDADDSWHDSNILSPRISTMRKLDSQSIRSGTFNDSATKSKDEFAMFGSFIRQKSERRNENEYVNTLSDRSRTVPRQSSSFKNLPVKEVEPVPPQSEYSQVIRSQTSSSSFSRPPPPPSSQILRTEVSRPPPPPSSQILRTEVSTSSSSFSRPLPPPSSQILRTEVSSSQPRYTPHQSGLDSFINLLQDCEGLNVDSSLKPSSQSRVESVPGQSPSEVIVPLRRRQVESVQAPVVQKEGDLKKDLEVARLTEKMDRMRKKMNVMMDNNEKMKKHLKDLLDERRQLLDQIANSEFEEIVEEEEVQKVKPKENLSRMEFIREDSSARTQEMCHMNCIPRDRVTLDDVPQKMLESFRTDILRQERERTELEKRSLVETLKMQQQKQIQALHAEHQREAPRRVPDMRHVAVQAAKPVQFKMVASETDFGEKTRFKMVASETDFGEKTRFKMAASETDFVEKTRFKMAATETNFENKQFKMAASQTVFPKTRFMMAAMETNLVEPTRVPDKVVTVTKSVGVNASATMVSRMSQSDGGRSLANQWATSRTSVESRTSYQESIVSRVMRALEEDDHEALLTTLDESLSKSVTSIGVLATPLCSCKGSNTSFLDRSDVTVTVDLVPEEAPISRVSLDHKGVLAKPQMTGRGCQPDDVFKFETGTVTDQLFCRSQGTNTTLESWGHRSPLVGDVNDSVVNRSTNRSETRKQTISHTSYLTSPTKEFSAKFERALSPRVTTKPVLKEPVETIQEEEHIVEVTSLRTHQAPPPRPVNVVEEVEHIVETKTQQVTSVLDSNKVPKREVPTTVECWETVAHLKDGHVVKETETYHDRLVSTDLDKIKAHLDKHESAETSPTSKYAPDIHQLSSQISFKREHASFSESSTHPKTGKETWSQSRAANETSSQSRVANETSSQSRAANETSSQSRATNETSSQSRATNETSSQSRAAKESTVYSEYEATFSLAGGLDTVSKVNEKDTVSSTTPRPRAQVESEEVKEVSVKEEGQSSSNSTIYEEYTEVIRNNGFKAPPDYKDVIIRKPGEFKEVKVSRTLPSMTGTQPLDQGLGTGALRRPSREITVLRKGSQPSVTPGGTNDVREVTIQQTSSRTQESTPGPVRSFESWLIQTTKDTDPSLPGNMESSFQESEQVVTSSSSFKVIPDSGLHNSSSKSSFSLLTSPTSFKSYSSAKTSSTVSSKNESFTYDSSQKGEIIPIEVKGGPSNETSVGSKIPINVITTTSRQNQFTRLPVNIINTSSGSSSSIASSHSAFRSLASGLDNNVQVQQEEHNADNTNEVLLSQTIFEQCNQLLMWLKSVSVVSSSTMDQLPPDLRSVSSSLIDWWINVSITVDSVKLMASVKYLIFSFSKMFLKYLIISLDQQGNSCLHYLIGHQLWDSYNVLDSTGLVDPNLYNAQGFTPLMVACTLKINSESGRANLRRLASNAQVNLRSRVQGQTAIFLAALHDNSASIQILYTRGADINIRDNDDMTPLMIACLKNNIDAATTILSWSGVLLDLKNKEGKTALDIAKEANFMDLVEVFNQRKSTRASEISTYSRILQNSSGSMSFSGTRRF